MSKIFGSICCDRTDCCRTEYPNCMGEKEITHRDLIGSPGYVKRVMMNILSNAMKYNKEKWTNLYISCIEIPSEQPETTTTMEFACRYRNRNGRRVPKTYFRTICTEHAGSRTKICRNRSGNADFKEID